MIPFLFSLLSSLSALNVVQKDSGVAIGGAVKKCTHIDYFQRSVKVTCETEKEESYFLKWTANADTDPPEIGVGVVTNYPIYSQPYSQRFSIYQSSDRVGFRYRKNGGFAGDTPSIRALKTVALGFNTSLSGHLFTLTNDSLVSTRYVAGINHEYEDETVFTFSNWERISTREDGPAVLAVSSTGIIAFSSGSWIVLYDLKKSSLVTRFQFVDTVDTISGLSLHIQLTHDKLFVITNPPLSIKVYNITETAAGFAVSEWVQSNASFFGYINTMLLPMANILLISSSSQGVYQFVPETASLTKIEGICSDRGSGSGPLLEVNATAEGVPATASSDTILFFVMCLPGSEPTYSLDIIEVTHVVDEVSDGPIEFPEVEEQGFEEWMLIVTILGMTFLVLTAVLLLYCCFRIRTRAAAYDDDSLQGSLDNNLLVEEMAPPPQSDLFLPWHLLTNFKVDTRGTTTATRNVTEVVALHPIEVPRSDDEFDSSELNSEICLLASLRQKDILMLYGWSQRETEIFAMTEYCSEGNLANMPFGQKLSREAAARSLIAIVRAVAFLHDRSMVHMDIGAHSVEVSEFHEMKLTLRPGITSALGEEVTLPVRNSAWRPPESSLQPCRATFKHDIYSFGCLLYEVLTGNKPSAANCSAATKQASIREAGLLSIISKCCCMDPEDRLTTGQITNAFLECESEGYVGSTGSKSESAPVDVSTVVCNSSASLQYDIYQISPSPCPLVE